MKIGKMNIAMLLTSLFVLMFSAVSFAKTAEDFGSFRSDVYHYDFGWRVIKYDLHVIEEYTVYKSYDEVEMEHHHAVASSTDIIGEGYSLEIQVSSRYRDGNGTIGRLNYLDYKWRDRLSDYISRPGTTHYGGGNTKLFTGTLSESPKVTVTSGAVAAGTAYGSTDSITLSLK